MTLGTRATDLRRRATALGDQAFQLCTIPGCGRLSEVTQGNGLSPTLCRYHREHRSRHGSTLKRSYNRGELRPHIRAAESFAKAHKGDLEIKWSIDRIAAE